MQFIEEVFTALVSIVLVWLALLPLHVIAMLYRAIVEPVRKAWAMTFEIIWDVVR